jgi:type VI protein secretion system component VasA
LRALAQRVAERHPDQARQLRHAAHEIAQHEAFFRNAG